MTSIILIIPYFGKWPLWFDAFLKSCEGNPSIYWYCPTDCDIPKYYPKNVTFESMSLQDLNLKVNQSTGIDVPLSARKLCDVRPAYGDIFQESISNYDFWGFCDMDVIWGDIRKFVIHDILVNYDIISSRKQAISGHFTLFKNKEKINYLYKSIPEFILNLQKEGLKRMDEELFTTFLITQRNVKVYWSKILLNQERGIDSHQEYYLDRWQWQDGKVVNTKTNTEEMYLHFINWKRTMRYSEVQYTDPQTAFYISYSGMHYQAHSPWQQLINRVMNVFNGYWVKEQRRKRKLKLKSLRKRLKIKLENL